MHRRPMKSREADRLDFLIQKEASEAGEIATTPWLAGAIASSLLALWVLPRYLIERSAWYAHLFPTQSEKLVSQGILSAFFGVLAVLGLAMWIRAFLLRRRTARTLDLLEAELERREVVTRELELRGASFEEDLERQWHRIVLTLTDGRTVAVEDPFGLVSIGDLGSKAVLVTTPVSDRMLDLQSDPPAPPRPSRSLFAPPEEAATPVDTDLPVVPEPSPLPTSAGTARRELVRIRGIGPAFARRLQRAGVTGLAEIAAWSEAELERIAERAGIPGERMRRDQWREQARDLLADEEG